jgi:hypothetical protein
MFIAYASAPGRTASDIGDKSGPYAAALAAELGHPGLDHLNLFQNVKEAVLTATGGLSSRGRAMAWGDVYILRDNHRRQVCKSSWAMPLANGRALTRPALRSLKLSCRGMCRARRLTMPARGSHR